MGKYLLVAGGVGESETLEGYVRTFGLMRRGG